jgi:hypothetical protein
VTIGSVVSEEVEHFYGVDNGSVEDNLPLVLEEMSVELKGLNPSVELVTAQ